MPRGVRAEAQNVIPEPDLGPPPILDDPIIRPPEQFPLELHSEEPEVETKRVVGELVDVGPDADKETVTELTDEEREWFRSLLTVGRRYKTISVMDHSIEIQTLTIADELRIGLFCKDYKDSQADYRSYQLAVCVAGIRSIDDAPLYTSLIQNPDENEVFTKKVDRLKEYYPVVVSQIYNKIVELDKEFAELAGKLGKLQG